MASVNKSRPKDRLKLAILSSEFLDAEVERLFLDCEVESLEDIEEVTGALARHRPSVVKKLEKTLRLVERYQRIRKNTSI